MTATEGKTDKLSLLQAEQQELIALCKSLTLQEWNAPSLCEGWSVRDVVAHLIGGQQDLITYFTSMPGKANQKQVDRRRNLSSDELIRQLEESTSKPGFIVKAAATLYIYDTWVHQQDIRWPLHKDRPQDPQRVLSVLNMMGKSAAKKLTERNQKLIATDIEWQLGEGRDEIKGPAEALAMFLAGRRKAALERLSGPGADKLK